MPGEFIFYLDSNEDNYISNEYPSNEFLSKELYMQFYFINNELKYSNDYFIHLLKKIELLHSNAKLLYIPKTLFELVFIRKCIQEDIKYSTCCSNRNHPLEYFSIKDFDDDEKKLNEFKSLQEKKMKQKKCWHTCYFSDHNESNNLNPNVIDIYYRLNKYFIKHKSEKINDMVENEIIFLKDYHEKITNGKLNLWNNQGGPTTCFGYEVTKGGVYPMGIRYYKTLFLFTFRNERDKKNH